MTKYTGTITADGATAICVIDRRRSDANNWQGTIFIGGTFGSGTVKVQFSPDGGITKFDASDWSGNPMYTSENAMFVNQPMSNGDRNQDYITLYAVMSGSTSPSVTVTVFDNR
jgi:hypothetical protein